MTEYMQKVVVVVVVVLFVVVIVAWATGWDQPISQG